MGLGDKDGQKVSENSMICGSIYGGCHQTLFMYVLTYTKEHSPSWEVNRFLASQQIPLILWNPEGSLPHPQVPDTRHPQPDRFSSCPHIPLPEDTSLYYPPIHTWVFQVVSFPQVFPTKTLYIPLLFPYVLHAPPISLFSIWSPEQYNNYYCNLIKWRRTAGYKARHERVRVLKVGGNSAKVRWAFTR